MNLPASSAASGVGRRRVFLVDDHPLVREWLTQLINGENDLVVSGEASAGPTALAKIIESPPDAAIVDLALSGGSGMDLVKDLRLQVPGVKVIVLSMHEEKFYAERLLRAGARAYVMKSESSKKILTAIRRVLEGSVYISERYAAVMAEKLVRGRTPDQAAQSPGESLSDRELEVFRLLGQGRGTPEIGRMLNISPKTVQAHCANIKEKLGLNNAIELLREAMRFEDRGIAT